LPHQSVTEREPSDWLTPPQAVALICTADQCDLECARQELREALADGALGRLRWKDEHSTPATGDAMVTLDPPGSDPHWNDVDFDWDAGTVRDDWSDGVPRHRVLLIHRQRLKEHWPEMYPRAGWGDADRYEAQQTRLMRKYRKQREAHDAALQAAWAAERSKPVGTRQWFRTGDLAEELAREPKTLEVNPELRDRIVEQLIAWTRNQQFDLSAGEVATLSGDPPSFEPLPPLDPFTVITYPEWLMLRRGACRRYIENTLLEGAPRLLREWFPETVNTPEPTPAGLEGDPSRVRRKRRTKADQDLRVREQIEAVLAAQRGRWRDPTKRPAFRQQARLLREHLRSARPPLDLSEVTIRQILSGRYRPMIRMGIGPVGPEVGNVIHSTS
jgi:hypothetical protein